MAVRHFLKSSESKKFEELVHSTLQVKLFDFLKEKPKIEVVEEEGLSVFIVNERTLFFKKENKIFPTLLDGDFLAHLPKAVVDVGAIPHVCNGADVMAPGIVEVNGEFKENSIVVVVEEKHQKPIAIGIALVDSKKAREMEKGKVLANVHYVGDYIWKFYRPLLP